MLEKLKALSTQAKIAAIAGVTAVTTLAVGVAVMQPWNRSTIPKTDCVIVIVGALYSTIASGLPSRL